MIIQELLQVAEIDFIARAPENTEVEYLTHKQIMKSLRDKVTAELFMEQNKWARPGGEKSKPKKSSASAKAKPAKAAPAKAAAKSAPPAKEAATAASPIFLEQLDQLDGSKNARLLMGEELADEVLIVGLPEVLESHKNNGVDTLIMDGVITPHLVDLAPKAGIKTIVAKGKAVLPREPIGLSLFTREDLA
jgi:DNA primase